MIDSADTDARAEALSLLLREKLGVRGSTLSARLSKAGRELPRRLRGPAQLIVDAQSRGAHPKLARLAEDASVDAAFRELTQFLEGIDASERRKTQLLRWLGGQVFNLILITCLVVILLRWQGLI